MADIVRLRDVRVRKPRRQETSTAGAKILLFTGVRYERRETAGKPLETPKQLQTL